MPPEPDVEDVKKLKFREATQDDAPSMFACCDSLSTEETGISNIREYFKMYDKCLLLYDESKQMGMEVVGWALWKKTKEVMSTFPLR